MYSEVCIINWAINKQIVNMRECNRSIPRVVTDHEDLSFSPFTKTSNA